MLPSADICEAVKPSVPADDVQANNWIESVFGMPYPVKLSCAVIFKLEPYPMQAEE